MYYTSAVYRGYMAHCLEFALVPREFFDVIIVLAFALFVGCAVTLYVPLPYTHKKKNPKNQLMDKAPDTASSTDYDRPTKQALTLMLPAVYQNLAMLRNELLLKIRQAIGRNYAWVTSEDCPQVYAVLDSLVYLIDDVRNLRKQYVKAEEDCEAFVDKYLPVYRVMRNDRAAYSRAFDAYEHMANVNYNESASFHYEVDCILCMLEAIGAAMLSDRNTPADVLCDAMRLNLPEDTPDLYESFDPIQIWDTAKNRAQFEFTQREKFLPFFLPGEIEEFAPYTGGK